MGHQDDAPTDLTSTQIEAATAIRRPDLHGSPTFYQPQLAGRNTSHGDYQALWTHGLKSVPEAQYPIAVSARWVGATQATLADAVQAHSGYEEEILRLHQIVKQAMEKQGTRRAKVRTAYSNTGNQTAVPR